MLFTYDEIEKYFNNLNKDKTHFNSTNDICTPMGCVKEMVEAIPQNFWLNQDLKILDPCCGNGNFPAYLALKTKPSNIYANEINLKRIQNLKNYFGDLINITEKDFFLFPDKEEYDLIIANPPFAKFTDEGKRAAKNHTLSRKFLEKSIKMVKENGFLVFILPDNWMSYADSNPIPKLLSNYKILTLNIGEVKRWFPGVGSSFTYFVIQKTLNNGEPTKIIQKKETTYSAIDKGIPCIPLEYNEQVRNIFNKIVFNKDEKYKVESSSNLHKYTKSHLISATESEIFKYRLIHTPNQTVWSKQPHIYQEGWKVFLPTTTYYKPFIDYDCGMTQSILFIKCSSKEEAEKICEEVSQPVYKVIIALTRYGNFNNQRVLQNLTKRNLFNLTKEEEDYINNFPIK